MNEQGIGPDRCRGIPIERIRARLAPDQLRGNDGTFVVARAHSGPVCRV